MVSNKNCTIEFFKGVGTIFLFNFSEVKSQRPQNTPKLAIKIPKPLKRSLKLQTCKAGGGTVVKNRTPYGVKATVKRVIHLLNLTPLKSKKYNFLKSVRN